MKNRLTITLSQDILRKIDAVIDNKSIRNRSQAIEVFLQQSLSPSIQTAVILAGGSPIKLAKGQEPTPRSLLPINGKPLILHTLKLLSSYNFKKVIICTGSDGDLIKKQCDSGQTYGMEIVYSQETKPLGTGGALKAAAKYIDPNVSFLVLHGDILTDINLDDFVSFFKQAGSKACVAIKPRPGRTTYGMVYLQGSNVINFKKPDIEPSVSLVNTGMYLFDPSISTMFPKQQVFKLEDTLIPELITQRQLTGFNFQGIWFDVVSPQDYHEASLRWKEKTEIGDKKVEIGV